MKQKGPPGGGPFLRADTQPISQHRLPVGRVEFVAVAPLGDEAGRNGDVLAGGLEGFAHEQEARGLVCDREGIAIAAVACVTPTSCPARVESLIVSLKRNKPH